MFKKITTFTFPLLLAAALMLGAAFGVSACGSAATAVPTAQTAVDRSLSSEATTQSAPDRVENDMAQATPAAYPAPGETDAQPSATTTPTDKTQETVEITLTTTYSGAVSVELQLLLGTLNLADTDLALTVEQATALLPLWEQFITLSQVVSPGQGTPGQGQEQATPEPQNGATQTQIENLMKQIQALMTAEQLSAITDMQITSETVTARMEELGLGTGAPQQGGGQPPDGMPQGTPPAGDPGGGGGTPAEGGQPPAGEQAPGGGGPQGGDGTQGGDGAQGGAQGRGLAGGVIPSGWTDALIQLLEETSGLQSSATAPQTPPGGQEPSGQGASGSDASVTISAAYVQNGGTESKTGQDYTATNTDQSAIYVTDGGTFTLDQSNITTSGDTSSDENSSFYGLNAAVLAGSGATINLSGSTIDTSGSGANGAFATGEGAVVNLSNVTIHAAGDGGHGVMATWGGLMTLVNVNITTSGPHSAPIATDRGSGTITATGGTVTTSGQDSPCYYSTGVLKISDNVCDATGSESVVIEGANSVAITDSTVTSSVADKWGVMIYQSFSGDAEGSEGVFTMTGGSLAHTATTGPLFYVTNTQGYITLAGVDVGVTSGTLLRAEGNDRWGTSGANGGAVFFTADGQTLTGEMTLDDISAISLTLQNFSSLMGALNAEHAAGAVNVTLDASSTWTVTADSYITGLVDADGISGTTISNIIGNGHTVYYDAAACPELGGQTYTLVGGGALQPAP